MKYKLILVLLTSALCSCSYSNSGFKQLESNQQKDTGLDNWGRGADPWMSDWEEKQREQAKRSQQLNFQKTKNNK